MLKGEVDRHLRWAEARVRKMIRREHPGEVRLSAKRVEELYPGERVRMAAEGAVRAHLDSLEKGGDAAKTLEREFTELAPYDHNLDLANTFNVTWDKQARCTIAQYNAHARHGEILMEMKKRNPALAMIWWNCMATQEPPLPDPRTPEEMAWTIRKSMRMGAAQWRAFMGLAPMTFTDLWTCLDTEDLKGPQRRSGPSWARTYGVTAKRWRRTWPGRDTRAWDFCRWRGNARGPGGPG